MTEITVIKRDDAGRETLRYSGDIIERESTWVCLRATFTYGERDLGFVVLHVGDILTEWFYSDRWFNVFRIEDKDSGALKGWYCNITRPAEITETTVASDDLALDVFVHPSGRLHVLDEDEYNALKLTHAERLAVQQAVSMIRRLVKDRRAPFAEVNRDRAE